MAKLLCGEHMVKLVGEETIGNVFKLEIDWLLFGNSITR